MGSIRVESSETETSRYPIVDSSGNARLGVSTSVGMAGYARTMEFSIGQCKAVPRKLAATYRRGSRKDKGRILDEL